MANQHGDFIWYELMTSDSEAARTFYGGLLGWTYSDSGQEQVDYRIFSAGDVQVGGFLQLTEPMIEHGAVSGWVGYVRVDDCEASVGAAREAGAKVLMEGNEVPGVGPFAMLQDPHGAPFYVLEDRSGEESKAFSATEPHDGTCAWNELMAKDTEAAKAFYGALFDWKVADTMDMGEMGKYDMLKNGAERNFMFGGLMGQMPDVPVSTWAFYFRLPQIDTAAKYITDNGGQILNGPMEVPGGEFIVNGVDPQGAMFSVIGKREG